MVSVGLAVAPVGKTPRRAHDVAGAFGGVTVLDLRGAELAEDLGVRRARGSKASLDVCIEAIGKARQRHANMSFSPGSSVTRFSGSGSCSTWEARRTWCEAWLRKALFNSCPRNLCRARSAAVVTGAPLGQDQPSLPISMRMPRFCTIDSGTCLEDGDLHTRSRKLRSEKRARDARTDNDHISFNVGHGWRQP